jgi:hypothetical protein
MNCPICGEANATCGGPSHSRPIDQPIAETSEVPTVAEREMVMVHVDDGTDRGQDFKYERKDAEKLLAMNPNARIVGDDAAAEDDGAESKAVEKAPANKARSMGTAGKK